MIRVTTVGGKTYCLAAGPLTCVRVLKAQIAAQGGPPARLQRLLLNNRILPDKTPLQEAGLVCGDPVAGVLTLVRIHWRTELEQSGSFKAMEQLLRRSRGTGGAAILAEKEELTWERLEMLEEIDCSGQVELTSIPEAIKGCTALRVLRLDNCEELVELPAVLGELAALEELHLMGCASLRQLPPTIGGCANLRVLGLEGCAKLETLPVALGKLRALERLRLYRCSSLRKLPEAVGGCASLKVLDLKVCKSLEQLPEALCQLSSLEALGLGGCSKLRRLPAAIGGCVALRLLAVRDCRALEALPETLRLLSNLRVVQ